MKNELKYNLCPHVKDDAYHVILLFSDELFLRKFVVVVVLIDEEVVEGEEDVCRYHPGNSDNTGWQ